MLFQQQIVQIKKYFPFLLKFSYIHICISQAKDQLLLGSYTLPKRWIFAILTISQKHTETHTHN